jgi:small GTP-binding protein
MQNSSNKFKNQNDLKIIIIGHVGTGKTSILNKWIKNNFSESYKATISTEFAFKIFEYNGKTYKIQLWDIGGQDRGPNFTKLFCKNSHGAIVVADITQQDTLEKYFLFLNRALTWKTGIDQNVVFIDGSPLPMVIIQNKLDKVSDLQDKADFMTLENLKEYSKKNKFDLCFQTSAKTGENIEDAISGFIRLVIDKYERYFASRVKETEVVEEKNKTVVLTNNNTPKDKKAASCC